MTIPPILKNKWVLIGGAAVVLIAFVASSSGGATTSSTAVGTSGPTDAQVAASRDITIAQLQMQAVSNQANAQVAVIGAQANADLARASLEAQLAQYAIDAQTAQQSQQYATSREIQLATLASEERRESAAINAQSQLAKWTLDQATYNTEIQTNFQLDYAEAANQTQVMLASMQTQLVNNQLAANRDVALAGFASQENMAAITAALQRDLTYSNNTTQAAIYASMTAGETERARLAAVNETERERLRTNSQNKQSSNNLIGGIVGGILGIFSDPRLKTDVEKLAEMPDGLGVYRYRYLAGFGLDESEQIGVMADEVAAIRPWALGPVVGGYATVNYGAL